MAVRFYEVIAFDNLTSFGNYASAGSYLGKTSDLVVKREEDKTVDLDNGDTEVGSEKISISFSILGEFQNPIQVKELWLVSVPPIDNPDLFDVIQIKLKEGDYQWEAKTGEFGKINFSATLRHSTDYEPISIIEGYGNTDCFIYIAELSGNIESKEFIRVIRGQDEMAYKEIDDVTVKGKVAVVDLLAAEIYEIKIDNDKIYELDEIQSHGLIKRKYVIT